MSSSLRSRLETIIFEADTPAGRLYDVVLIVFILVSVILVILESVGSINQVVGRELYIAEWFFTLLFTAEYLLRLIAVRRTASYAFSFFGLIDLLAILPTYISLFIPGAQSLLIIRVFRLLRIFRVLKLAQFLGEADMLLAALRGSAPKITVFLMVVLSTVLTTGALMYVIEGPQSGFTSIPVGIYWAIVTMTTVGFGDITPQTPLGQLAASCLMILGYGVIAVPTGIVTTELTRASKLSSLKDGICTHCGRGAHDKDAFFCRGCGANLSESLSTAPSRSAKANGR